MLEAELGNEQSAPTIHQASRSNDGSGAVIKGSQIDELTAVNERIAGDDVAQNRRFAMRIEQTVGPWLRQLPHRSSAGDQALPHFQQRNPPPEGHTFYETAGLKARKHI